MQAYRELAGLSEAEVHRARRVRALMEIGWLALHLSLVVPQRFAAKQFADPRFQVTEHVGTTWPALGKRLRRADQILLVE